MAVFCCQAEDGIRDLVRSRGLGDVYKRQDRGRIFAAQPGDQVQHLGLDRGVQPGCRLIQDQQLSLIHI